MIETFLISTNHQKVLSLFAKFSDLEFYEREVARKIGISTGSSNRVLNDLFGNGLLKRRQEGKMYFYQMDESHPVFKYFKILNNIVLLMPLVESLKNITKRIVLYGSCSEGNDTSESDIDLFVLSENRGKALQIINNYSLRKPFEDIRIQPVIQSAEELLKSKKSDKEFLSLVREGIILWEHPTDESRL